VLDTPANAVNDQTTKFSGTVGLRESDTFAAWLKIVLDEPAKRQLLIGALIGRSPIVLTKTAKSTLQKPCSAELSESAFLAQSAMQMEGLGVSSSSAARSSS